MSPKEERRSLIKKEEEDLSIVKQCEMMSIARSVYYYDKRGESSLNLELMKLMDEHYIDHPFKGARRMHTWLKLDKNYDVSLNRIERLYYKVMGLRSIMPGPHTSKRCKDHPVFPYLLRGLDITHSNHVWATDITYIPMHNGFMYLIAFIDLYSRYVLHWSLSNSMEAEWCKEALEETLLLHEKPGILNTDQGSQFTSDVFSSYVLGQDIRLSMDGKGRATDNAFIECLWKNIKYEKIYKCEIRDGQHLFELIHEYFVYYNLNRRHTSIKNMFPNDLYYKQSKVVA